MTGLISDTETESPIEIVGGKAHGLLKLKNLEDKLNELYKVNVIVPSFFVVPSEISLAENHGEIRERTRSLGGETFAVRSSSALEDTGEHSFDGIFDTYLNVPLDRLVRVIREVRISATSYKAQRYSRDVGIELDGRMPVIVQPMINDGEHTGVVYSKFPAARDITKVVREGKAGGEEIVHVDILPRKHYVDGSIFVDDDSPIAVSVDNYYGWSRNKEVGALADLAVKVENEFGYPIILEFISSPYKDDLDVKIWALQARKLTKVVYDEKFQMPELDERGLIATTFNPNSVGDFTGEAFFVGHLESIGLECDGIREFDATHPQGYVLVTPYIEFFNCNIDYDTTNKRAVIAYTDLGKHHDLEIARKKGLLYLNCQACLNHAVYNAKEPIFEEDKKAPVETGEMVRVVSDGERGFVYNLSRM